MDLALLAFARSIINKTSLFLLQLHFRIFAMLMEGCYRWRLSRHIIIYYNDIEETITFIDHRHRRNRLTLRWLQFLNLHSLVGALLISYHRKRWPLGNRVWLLLDRPDGFVRLQISRPWPDNGDDPDLEGAEDRRFIQFSPNQWKIYKRYIQRDIHHIHQVRPWRRRQQHAAQTNDNNINRTREQRQRRRRQHNTRDQVCERHVRHRSSIIDQSGTTVSPIRTHGTLPVQTVSRAPTNAARLPSTVAVQHSSVSRWQNPSNGTTFSFRRAVNDYLISTAAQSSAPNNGSGGGGGGDATTDTETAEFSDLCSIGDECEIE